MTNARIGSIVAALLLALSATGCGESDDSGSSDPESTGSANDVGNSCAKAPKSVVRDISRGLTAEGYELQDAVMLAVPKDEQNTSGYPVNMVAANIVGEGGASTAKGVWAVNDADSPGPIFALNPPAQLLTDWGAAIQDGSPMAENRDIMASSDTAAAVEDCLS
jgi:hypothetical protein